MALIQCPNCGKPISDKAIKCPKCECDVAATLKGSTITANEPVAMSKEPQQESKTVEAHKESEGRSWRGVVVGASVVVIILLLVGGGWLWKSNHDAEIAAEQQRQEQELKRQQEEQRQQELLAQKQDSIWANFQTQDLRLLDLKGFVKEVVIKETKSVHNQSSVTYRFCFDKQGNLTSLNNLSNSAFKRDSDGRIVRIMLRQDAEVSEESAYDAPVEISLELEYGSELLNKISYSSTAITITYNTCVFTNFNDGRFTSYRYEAWERGFGTVENIAMECEYSATDSMGNWTKRKDKGKENAGNYGDEVHQNSAENIVTRTITYYNRNEIDLTEHLN